MDDKYGNIQLWGFKDTLFTTKDLLWYYFDISSATGSFKCMAQLITQIKKCMKGNTHE